MANASFCSAFQNTANNEFDLQIAQSSAGSHSSEVGEARQSPILVLSRYSALIETVRKTAPRGVPVLQAPDLDHAAEKMRSLGPGVLVADTASTSDIAAMVAQLTPHFPGLVVVVAGQREDSATLTQLSASGHIFRFLFVPLSHGQTRLTLEAAMVQHKQLSTPSPRIEEHNTPEEDEKRSGVTNYVAFAAGFAVGLIVLLVGIWWFVSREASAPQAPVAAAVTTAPKMSTGADRRNPVRTELDRAQEAFARGEYVEPVGESALDDYRSALNIEPASIEAQEGIHSIVEKVLERAGAALSAEKIEDAVKAIETARDIDPYDPRLAFLDAQVARERERIKLSQPRDVRRKNDTQITKAGTLANPGKLVSPAGGGAGDAELVKAAPAPAPISNPSNDAGNNGVDRSQQLLTAARDVSVPGNEGPISQAERELAEARTSTAGGTGNIVAAATLRRTKLVEPVYPAAARRRNEKGLVEVVFTVTPDGGVDNVEVRKSNPARVFDDAAIEAVEQWRFEPVTVNGQAVSQRAVARLMFSMD